MKTPTLFLLPILLLVACDPQESPSYEGEPVARLRGSVVAVDDAPDQAQAAILWYTSDLQECQGPTLSCGYAIGGSDISAIQCVDACSDPVCTPEAADTWTACVRACGDIEVSTDLEFEGCAAGGVGEAVDLSVDSFPGNFELALYDVPTDDKFLRGQDDGPRVAMGVLVALSSEAPDVFDFLDGDAEFQTILGGVTTHFLIYSADPIPSDSAWGQYLGGAFDVGYHLVRYDADVDCETFGDACSVDDDTEIRSPETQGFDVELELGTALRATRDLFDVDVTLLHAFDLPVVTIGVGLAGGPTLPGVSSPRR